MSSDVHAPRFGSRQPRRRAASSGYAAGPLAVAGAAAIAVAMGLGLGVLATAAAVRSSGIGAGRIGPWRLFADAGTPAANPYGRARAARTGEIPLAAAEGLTILARRDSAGEALEGRCAYQLAGRMPPARFWSLAAASVGGQPFTNAAGRQAFTSADVLRDSAGAVAVAVAPTVQPGNWLPLPGSGRFVLVLRLYETGLTGMGSAGLHEADLPTITRTGCAP